MAVDEFGDVGFGQARVEVGFFDGDVAHFGGEFVLWPVGMSDEFHVLILQSLKTFALVVESLA
ncbi:hypothetical protein [Stackebrandtia nassauensis]|uniref:hypothetical protein n=1 Tax=Stackebrandtia nassauensis TaxID=283811 RepID=UPI0005A2C848|nr:hypothetical protein [Stackebrandtia nassauensis]